MKFKSPLKAIKLISMLVMLSDCAYADVGGGAFLPGGAMPENVSKSLRQQHATTGQAQPSPNVQQPKPQPQSALNAQAQKIKFTLNGIILKGNHVYPTSTLELIYKDKLHKEITVADLFTIVQDITNFYRNNGYIISRAVLPPQHVKNGVVEIQIIEGFLDKVTVTGTPRGAKCLVEGFGKQIAKPRPLEISHMEKYLTLANEIPNTQVRAVLSPSQNVPGAADLSLVTDNKVFSGYASYDNYGTRYIGPQQMTANFGVNSVINSGDSTQMTFTKTPRGGELTYTDVNYGGALDDEGDRYQLGGTRAHTHPLFVLQPEQVDGVNMNYYANAVFPIIRTRTKSLTITTSFNYLDSEVNNFGNQQLYTDHLRNFGLSAMYNFSDQWFGANMISGEFRQGLPLFGYTTNTNPQTAQTSRPGGRGDYTKVDGAISRLQVIGGPWSVYGIFRGQWAFNPLLASEQFSVGGSQLGRGYDTAEIIGDRGIASSVELRYDYAVGRLYIQALQLYAFYDGGAIWDYKSIVGTPTKQTILSTGAGVRFYMNKYVSGNIMWAQPLTKQVLALAETSQHISHGIAVNRGNGAAPRVFFSVVAQLD